MPHRGKVVGLVCHHRQRLREQVGRRRSQAGCVPVRGQQATGVRTLQGSRQANWQCAVSESHAMRETEKSEERERKQPRS